MKRLVMMLGIFWLVASAPNVLATGDGVLLSDQTRGPTQYSPAISSLIEAWNDNGELAYAATYTSPCFAFHYVPSVSYVLERIDWYAGDLPGTVTTTVRSESLNGVALASVTYQESPPQDWQGANLIPPVLVTAGESYYLVYNIVVGAQVSAASVGNSISHWHDPGGACSSWSGPWDGISWRARFYGSIPTPTASGTWGRIKNIYR